MENLDELVALDSINLANNLIQRVTGLKNLSMLTSLNLSHNLLKVADDIRELEDCPSIITLDLSLNKLDDPQVLQVFENLPNLRVLNLMGNGVIRKINPYRKTMVARLKSLTYLDDRPVFEQERLQVEAWAVGGVEGEREERQRQREEEKQKMEKNLQDMLRIKEEAHERRRINNPDEDFDKEPEFSEEMTRFRDEMLARIGTEPISSLEQDDIPMQQTTNHDNDDDDNAVPIRHIETIDVDGNRIDEPRIVEIN